MLRRSQTSRILGRTTTPGGVAPQADKVKNSLSKHRFPKSKNALQRLSDL